MVDIGEKGPGVRPPTERAETEHPDPAAGVEDHLRRVETIEVFEEQGGSGIDGIGRENPGRGSEVESIVVGDDPNGCDHGMNRR